jgi:hypothetical protein
MLKLNWSVIRHIIFVTFLCSGVTIEYFKLDGNTPEFSDVLIMRHKGELIKGALTFSIFNETSSYPHEFFHGKE